MPNAREFGVVYGNFPNKTILRGLKASLGGPLPQTSEQSRNSPENWASMCRQAMYNPRLFSVRQEQKMPARKSASKKRKKATTSRRKVAAKKSASKKRAASKRKVTRKKAATKKRVSK
ncbi:MAG: hypothetical protein KAJ57_05950, partial [Woeseiaceae bacterium]|nr:hypothetical protein [Woeseiaceae bacterium]